MNSLMGYTPHRTKRYLGYPHVYQMKNTSLRTLALIVITFILGFASSRTASAYGPYQPYTYGQHGYWNNQHVYHQWDRYNGHQGYWYHRNDGVRIFITI